MARQQTLKTLILTDTSATARALRRLFGRQYAVISTDGFLRDMPRSQLGLDVENDFAMKMITVRGKAKLLHQLESDTLEALRIYLATEPTCEGEALAAHYCRLFGINPESKCRVELHELTKAAVKSAIENARAINNRAVEEYWTRQSINRLIKHGLSQYLWCAVYRGLSINQMQLLLLRLIKNFEPPRDAIDLPEATTNLKALQLWAARDLKFLAGRVVLNAQRLYEGVTVDKTFTGLLTYYRDEPIAPVTDFSPEAIKGFVTSSQLKVYDAIWNGRVPWSTEAPPLDVPTDFTLMIELERLGIDWIENYSPAINTLVKINYVDRTERGYVLTELGDEILTALDKFFSTIDAKFFIEIEDHIKAVSEGRASRVEVLKKFYAPFNEMVSTAMKSLGDDPQPKEPPIIESDQICEKCGRRMVIRRGRYGKFLACPGYPECKNSMPYVEFLNYKCPKCGGRLTSRAITNRRTFYSCEHYPECDFWTWDAPQNKPCPICGSLMLRHTFKDGQSMLYCSNENCSSRANHPINRMIEKSRRRYEERLQKASARSEEQ